MNIISIARSPKQLTNIIGYLNKNFSNANKNYYLIVIDNKGSSIYQDIQIKNLISDKLNCKYNFIFNDNKFIFMKILTIFFLKFYFKKYISCIGDPTISLNNNLIKFIYFSRPDRVNIFDDGIVSARYSGKFSNKVFFYTSYYDLFEYKNNVYKFDLYPKISKKPNKKLLIIGQNLYGKNMIFEKHEYLKIIKSIIKKFNKDHYYIPHRNEKFEFLKDNNINVIEPNLDINDLFFNKPNLISDSVFGFFSSALIDLRFMFTNKNINFFFYRIDTDNINFKYIDEIYEFYGKLKFIEIE